VPTQAALSLVPDTGGAPQPLVPLAENEATHRWPQFLPGGEHVLYTAHDLLDTFDEANIRVVSIKTGTARTLVQGGYFGRYLASGHLLYMRGGILYGVRFNLEKLEVASKPTALVHDIGGSSAWGAAQFDVSNTGTLVYRQPLTAQWPLAWMESTGDLQSLGLQPGSYYGPRLSPDGGSIAFSTGIANGDITVYDWQRATRRQLTTDGHGHFSPVWAPDGKHVVYRTHVQGTDEFALDWARADGGGEPQRLLTTRLPVLPGDISASGDLLYVQGRSGYDIWSLPLDLTDPERPKPGTPVAVLVSPANELQPVLSPDGRWLAYVSNAMRQGRSVMVRPYPGSPNAPERRWQISSRGAGDLPVWSRTGKLFYSAYTTSEPTARDIFMVPYQVSGDTFVAEEPVRWSKQPHLDLDLFRSFDVSSDGNRFVVVPSVDTGDVNRWRSGMTVLLNFFDEMKRRIP
jgi:serine/threonine-protein kinase